MTARSLTCSAIALAVSISTGYAGPCSSDIANMQARIDTKVAAMAASGPTAQQGPAAGMSRQPTPHSMAEAEARLGQLSSETVDTVRQAMVRARAADSTGDKTACEQALAEVERAMGP